MLNVDNKINLNNIRIRTQSLILRVNLKININNYIQKKNNVILIIRISEDPNHIELILDIILLRL